jgi:hypothetical protein
MRLPNSNQCVFFMPINQIRKKATPVKYQTRFLSLPLLLVPVGMVTLPGCEPKTKEKIVYIEVPVETITNSEKLVPGETVTTTIEKEKIVTQTQPLTVDDAVVTLNPGTLALSTGISLIPPKKEDETSGGLGLRGFSPLRSMTEESEYDKFEEDIVIWNPAQEPLKNVNNYLCLIGKTAYNQAAANDHAARIAADPKAKVEVDVSYIAKITVGDCFSRSTSMTSKAGNSNTS